MFSNEAVNDSDPAVIDAVGQAMVRAVAAEADKGILTGAGGAKGPAGIFGQITASVPGAVDYPNIVRAAGKVRAAGGTPNAVYVNPDDFTELQLATDANDRPLIQPDPSQGPAQTVAGLMIWPTPAIAADTAVVAQATEIIVALRRDPSIEVSDQALFSKDGTVARVIARLDAGVGDPDGLCKIAAA